MPLSTFEGTDLIHSGTVTGVEREERIQTMYNLTVAEAHTFFVGEGEWLVHNTGQPCFKILEGRQGKHIFGHPNFDEGKSVLTHSDPQALVNQFASTGTAKNKTPWGEPGHVEVVDFGQEIGWYVDGDTGFGYRTTNGTIKYAKDGVHIVPARP